MRAFLAIPIPKEQTQQIIKLAQQLKQEFKDCDIRWTKPNNYHITLYFFHQLHKDQLPLIQKEMTALVKTMAPFNVRLLETVLFPSKHHPKVVSFLINDATSLLELAVSVQGKLAQMGFKQERRSFRPHLSLGRLRGKVYPILKNHIIHTSDFKVNQIVLFQSHQEESGVKYEPLFYCPLGE